MTSISEFGKIMPSLMATTSSKMEKALKESLKMASKASAGTATPMAIFTKDNGGMMSRMAWAG